MVTTDFSPIPDFSSYFRTSVQMPNANFGDTAPNISLIKTAASIIPSTPDVLSSSPKGNNNAMLFVVGTIVVVVAIIIIVQLNKEKEEEKSIM